MTDRRNTQNVLLNASSDSQPRVISLGIPQWGAGVNAWFNWTDNHLMTTNYAHEAKKNPAHLLYKGQMYYVPNTGAQYIDGFQSRTAVFGQQQLRFFNKLNLRLGMRLEYSAIRGKGSHNLDGKTNNSPQNRIPA